MLARVKVAATTGKGENEKSQTEKKKAGKDIKHEIIESLGVISTSSAGWTKEVNLISWNDNPAKIDIRDWSPKHEKIGKGITLTTEEAAQLIEILQSEI